MFSSMMMFLSLFMTIPDGIAHASTAGTESSCSCQEYEGEIGVPDQNP